jgi:glycosyltransferase involved in cell wall biosynthesis
MGDESVSILIPTYNRRDVLIRTIESLRQLRVPSGVAVELLVVANACTDDTVATVEAAAPSMPFPTRCVSELTPGLNAARNRCVTEAAGDILAFLDDDVWVEPDWLAGLLEVYRSCPADMVGGRVYLWWEAVQPPPWMSDIVEDRISSNDQGDAVREYDGGKLAIGANISFRRKVFETVGLFRHGLDRTGTSLLGGGETELVDRAVKAGLRMFYAPKAVVKHWVAPERIESKYLSRVSFGAGQTAIFRLPRFGAPDVMYHLAGRTSRLVRHGLLELWAAARGDRKTAIANRMHRVQAMGGFAGIWQRLRGRSPVIPDEPLSPIPPLAAPGARAQA